MRSDTKRVAAALIVAFGGGIGVATLPTPADSVGALVIFLGAGYAGSLFVDAEWSRLGDLARRGALPTLGVFFLYGTVHEPHPLMAGYVNLLPEVLVVSIKGAGYGVGWVALALALVAVWRALREGVGGNGVDAPTAEDLKESKDDDENLEHEFLPVVETVEQGHA